MKQLTIHIPEHQFQFVVDLLQKLRFVKIDTYDSPYIITEEQKALVNEELRKIKNDPGYLLEWDEVKHKLNA